MSTWIPITSGRPTTGGVIRKHATKPNVFQCRVYLGRDEAGKRHWDTRTVRGSLKKARAKLTEMLHVKQQGQRAARRPTTFRELVDRWLAFIEDRGLSPKTVRGYRDTLMHYVVPLLGQRKSRDITTHDIDALYGRMRRGDLPPTPPGEAGWMGRPLSARTVQITHTAVRCVLQQAVKWREIERNVADDATVPASEPRVTDWLTVEDRARFLAESGGGFYYAWYHLLLDSGLRPGEAAGLRWSDIDLAHSRLSVRRAVGEGDDGPRTLKGPKTRSGLRNVPITPSLAAALAEHKVRQAELGHDTSGHVFTNTRGEIVLPGNFPKRSITAIAKRAGIDKHVTPYVFRHTFASLTGTLADPVPIEVLQKWMGHSTIRQTGDTYRHLDDDLSQRYGARYGAALEEATREIEDRNSD